MLKVMPRISGEKLRKIRDKRLVSQRELAEKADLGPTTILKLALASRHADLTKRLTAMYDGRDRYIRLCAQGYISERELDGYLADLRTQTDNVGLLLESVAPGLAARHAETELAASTGAWRRSGREGSLSGSWSKVSSLRTSVRARNPESVSPTGSTSLGKKWARLRREMVSCVRCSETTTQVPAGRPLEQRHNA
jgi:transcriptional regulator with XRE-family HTH domain